MEARFIAYIADRVPKNPSLSSNLDYWLFRDVYQLADGRRFVLYRTSAHYSFCGISGQFTETAEIPVTIDGEEVTIGEETLWVQADDWMEKAHKSAVPHILTESEWNELKDIAITV